MLRSTGTTPGSRLAIPRYELGSKRRQILPLVGGGGGSSACNISRGSGRTCALRGGAIFADQAQASLDAVARLRRGPNRFQGDLDAICRDWELDAPVSIRPSKLFCLLYLLCRRRAGRSSAGAGPPGRRPASAGLSGAPARGPVPGR
jgi:hypothetical protein